MVTMTSPARRMFRKLPPQVRKYLIAEAQKLSSQPNRGGQLEGRLRAFRSLHIKHNNIQYRVIYEVSDRLKEIVVRAVGKRENFYKKIQQMKLKSLAS